MTAAVGYPTLRLVRVQIANWRLADLQPGQWISTTAPVKPDSGYSCHRLSASISLSRLSIHRLSDGLVCFFQKGARLLRKSMMKSADSNAAVGACWPWRPEQSGPLDRALLSDGGYARPVAATGSTLAARSPPVVFPSCRDNAQETSAEFYRSRRNHRHLRRKVPVPSQ